MGTTAFVVTKDQPRASQYYQTFPSEPVLPGGFLEVDVVVPIESVDVFKLLTAIANRSTKNVLIVSHGTGGGLAIPLTSKTKKTLGEDETDVLNQYVDGSIKDKEAASRLELRPDDVLELKRAILNVRRLRIDRLVMRACIVGTFLESLRNLRLLFGAKIACAPRELEAFGRIDPGAPASASAFAEFVKSPSVIVEGNAPNRFAWSVITMGDVKFEAKAESRSAVTDWISRHFPKGKYRGSGPIPFQALLVGDKLIFPLDREYRDHLSESESLE